MKKVYLIILMSAIGFTACTNVSPQTDIKTNDKFVEVDVSKLGLENSKNEKEVHVTYDANDEKEKEYQQLQEIDKENKINDEKEFKSFIREEGRK